VKIKLEESRRGDRIRIPYFIKSCNSNSEKTLTISKLLLRAYFLLNEFNPNSFIRSRNVMRKLKIKAGERIFDAGCGVGFYSLRLAYKGAYVVGGDLLPLFRYARDLGDNKLLKFIDFVLMDLNYIPIRSKVFDKIICVDVLEHIHIDEKVVAEFSRILKNNGELLVHVPNLNRYAILKAREKQRALQLEKGYGHVRSGYTLNQLSPLLEKNGIQVRDYNYTFGFWSRVAGNFYSVFKNTILIFPLLFFLALVDKASKTSEYNGGILIIGKKVRDGCLT